MTDPSDPSDLVAELARLSRDEQRRLFEAAADERERTIGAVLIGIRRAHLAEMSGRAAAREIYNAARGCRAGAKDPALRSRIRSLLKKQLGNLEDLPGESTVRKIPGFGYVFDY